MQYLSTLAIIIGIISGFVSLYEFLKTKRYPRSWRPGTVFAGVAVVMLVAAFFLANLTPPTGSTGTNTSSSTPGTSQLGTGVTPGQATLSTTPTPTPTLVIIHNKQLSQNMLLDNSCGINFDVPPQDVVVNNRLLQADFSMNAFSQCAFKLDTQQKSLQIECGLADNGNYKGDRYELKVLGDNQELLSQVYTAGNDAIAKEVGIQGVQILTFELKGTYYNPAFYCKDQLIY